MEALASTTKDLEVDEMVGLVLKAGEVAVTTMATLDEANTTAYGNPEITEVNIGVGSRPGILISGHDLKDNTYLDRFYTTGMEIETGKIVGGFAHNQILALADKVIDAVKSGAIKRFVVLAGCDKRQKSRGYFTEVAEELPDDAVILTAGCAKYRYNKLDHVKSNVIHNQSFHQRPRPADRKP